MKLLCALLCAALVGCVTPDLNFIQPLPPTPQPSSAPSLYQATPSVPVFFVALQNDMALVETYAVEWSTCKPFPFWREGYFAIHPGERIVLSSSDSACLLDKTQHTVWQFMPTWWPTSCAIGLHFDPRKGKIVVRLKPARRWKGLLTHCTISWANGVATFHYLFGP